MSGTRLAVVAACTLGAIAVVGWLGYEYRNEAVAFLRALVRFR